MSMKKTDLEKSKMLKASNAIKIAGVPDRFGAGSAIPDRKEQRKRDQAAGLVPFACKLPSDLLARVREKAVDGDINAAVAALLEKGLKGK